MAGLQDTDIRLDDNWQLVAATTGDALLVSDVDCFFQDIRVEALSQEGELFYDESWGWSLLDFIQSQDDEMTRLEIEQRVVGKLSRRLEINSDTIQATIAFASDQISVHVAFKFWSHEGTYELDISLNRISVEVTVN